MLTAFAFCNRSLHFFSDNTNDQTFRNLGERADGNVVGEF